MNGARVLARAFVLSALAVLAAPGAARAESASALFDRGVAQLEGGHFDEACPLIEQSYKEEPLPGTLFTLAECEAQRGRLATAIKRYDEYLSVYAGLPPDKKKKQADRERVSRAQVAALTARAAALTLVLPATAPPDTVVSRGDAEITREALKAPIRVDPGEHVITVRVPGESAREVRVSVKNGERKTVALPVDGGAPAAPESPTNWRQFGMLVAGGMGLVGLIAGGITGGLALSKKGVVNKHCGRGGIPEACDSEGFEASQSLKQLGASSTVMFAVGGAGVVTAIVLLATDSKDRKQTSALGLRVGFGVGAGAASAHLQGAW